MTRGEILLAVPVVALAACAPQQETFCGCVDLESSVQAVEQVMPRDWKSEDEGSVAQVWPEANPVPCEPSPGIGLEAVTKAIQRCCDSCGTCGGPHFREGDSSDGGLLSISVAVCRESSGAALSELKRLVDRAVPDRVDAVYEEGWVLPEGSERVYNGYRWHSDTDTFILDVRMGLFGDQWFGSFDITRCTPVESSEQWVLDSGKALEILEAEFRESGDGERQLWFSYLSECLLSDNQCLASEWRSFWPRLQARATQDEVTRVFLTMEDCKGGTSAVGARLRPSGEWDLPW